MFESGLSVSVLVAIISFIITRKKGPCRHGPYGWRLVPAGLAVAGAIGMMIWRVWWVHQQKDAIAGVVLYV
jgi:hypothetical protein